jgi:hypothetical protein
MGAFKQMAIEEMEKDRLRRERARQPQRYEWIEWADESMRVKTRRRNKAKKFKADPY